MRRGGGVFGRINLSLFYDKLLYKYLEELIKIIYDTFTSFFSTYFLKFSRITYKNILDRVYVEYPHSLLIVEIVYIETLR